MKPFSCDSSQLCFRPSVFLRKSLFRHGGRDLDALFTHQTKAAGVIPRGENDRLGPEVLLSPAPGPLSWFWLRIF